MSAVSVSTVYTWEVRKLAAQKRTYTAGASQITPKASMASATFLNPATLAPST